MNKHYAYDKEFNMVDKDGKKYILKVFQDNFADNPRDWDNVSTIWCWKRGYQIGDKVSGDIYENLENLCREYTDMSENKILDSDISNMLSELQKSDNLVIIPINCYDHSGISISTSSGFPYNDRWDGGMIGFAFIDKDTASKNFINFNEVDWKERAKKIIDGEVETLNQYIDGDVYRYNLFERVIKQKLCPHCNEVIKEYKTTNLIDSCGGFYGDCLEENGILDEIGSLKFEEKVE